MAKATDPVCGMTIDTEAAKARVELGGRTYYFCAKSCATEFEANPERYLGADAPSGAAEPEQREQHEPPYTLTGFLLSPKFGSAGSGGLEYELLPEAHHRKEK